MAIGRIQVLTAVVVFVSACSPSAPLAPTVGEVPSWAHDLFDGLLGLEVQSASEDVVVYVLEGNAHQMASEIEARLIKPRRFLLLDQVLVIGHYDQTGQVSVLWSKRAEGEWLVEAELDRDATEEWP